MNLSYNKIKDVRKLTNLTKLETLELKGNLITNYEILKNF